MLIISTYSIKNKTDLLKKKTARHLILCTCICPAAGVNYLESDLKGKAF